MGSSSNHEEEHEWDLVEEFGHDLCGSFETSLSLGAQKDGTHPPSRHHSLAKSNPNTQTAPHSIFRPYRYATIISFKMDADITHEDAREARNLKRMAARVKGLAWTFAGVPKSNAHQRASSKGGGSVPSEFAEEDREQERANYLSWMFNGVHMSDAHEDWDMLSTAEQDALKAKFSNGRQFSKAQVRREDVIFHGSCSPDSVAR